MACSRVQDRQPRDLPDLSSRPRECGHLAGTVDGMVQFVDWDLAASTAGALGKSGPRVSLEEAAEAVADLRRLADEASVHVAEYTQLKGPESPVRVVDRKDWAAANIA